jgi:phage tail protein X
LGPAIAVLLFNDYGLLQPAKCYLYAKGIDRLDPFLPVLKEVAESGPFLFVAIELLNLLEVAPRPEHLLLISAAGKSWLTSNPDDRVFWIDHGVGRRLCSVIEAVLAVDPKLFSTEQPLRKDIDSVLAGLVRLGVPEAHRLEEALRLHQ